MEQDGFVYFVSATGIDKVKIGWTENPVHRLACLQTGSPVKLKMLRIMPAVLGDERALHTHFAASRERGEWFRLSPELTTFIDRIPGRPWLVMVGELEDPSLEIVAHLCGDCCGLAEKTAAGRFAPRHRAPVRRTRGRYRDNPRQY